MRVRLWWRSARGHAGVAQKPRMYMRGSERPMARGSERRTHLRDGASDCRAVRRVGWVLVACAMVVPSVARADEPRVDAETRRTIDGALRWLAAHQQPDGNWGEHRWKVAHTGYALLAFMAAGQLPDEGEHGAVVAKGVRYLTECVRPDVYVVAPR